MDTIVGQWLERAEYDFETARQLAASRRNLYVAFMCQQCVEKLIKAYIAHQGNVPPFIHNLLKLAEAAGLMGALSEGQRTLLAELNPYYIKARYGEYKDSLSKVCSDEKAAHFVRATGELMKWLRAEIR